MSLMHYGHARGGWNSSPSPKVTFPKEGQLVVINERFIATFQRRKIPWAHYGWFEVNGSKVEINLRESKWRAISALEALAFQAEKDKE
jgi:hypothetical protein